MLKRIEAISAEPPGEVDNPFTEFEEEVLVSLAIDSPEYFQSVAGTLNYTLFTKIEVKYVMSYILEYYEKYGRTPTRRCLRDQVLKEITVDDPGWEEVRTLIDRPASPRDLPVVKEVLNSWVRKKSFGQLYEPEAIQAYTRGDYDRLEEIFNSANRMIETSARGFWLFEQYEELFAPDNQVHIKTGFATLDRVLNGGGPSPGEVICFLAATNVGKSLLLCNNAIYQAATLGNNTLLFTFEMDRYKVAERCLGAMTGVNIEEFRRPPDEADDAIRAASLRRQDTVKERVRRNRASTTGDLCIIELPPDECSVNNIYSEIHQLQRTRGWRPRVVVIDYLDLMIGRREMDNKDSYTCQKQVATQIRGLAKNEQVLVFTATQGNRSSNDTNRNIDLNQIAESYGKSMSLDYVISLNQTPEEYAANRLRMFVAKNRNGPKHTTISCALNYQNMRIREGPDAL